MAGPDPIMAQVGERLRAKAGAAGTIRPPESILDWASRYRQIDRRPFSLDRYYPLRAIYEDTHPRIVIMKPAQRGVSEFAINYAFAALEHGARWWVPDGSKSGLNVAIVFPARTDLLDFSKERVEALKSESTHLAVMLGGADEFDSLGFKQVGDSYLYLRGGNSRAGLRSFAADVLILDEFDELDGQAVALSRRRMNASLVRRELCISTPSIPGHGIDAEYASSDQRVYESQCPACGTWTTFDFFRDVRVAEQPYDEWQKWSPTRVESSPVTLHCPSCKVVITPEARMAPGRWVAREPQIKRTHGYHIPWWPWIFVDLAQLAAAAVSPNPADLEELYHSDLGLAYGVGGGQITDEMLAQLAAWSVDGMAEGRLPEHWAWRDMTMGIDVGNRFHFRVSGIGPDNLLYVRDAGSVASWAEVDQLMLRYSVRMAVVDAEPELHESLNFCKRWGLNGKPGRARRAFYPTGAAALKGTHYAEKKDSFDVQVNRTMGLDYVYAQIAGARERWPAQLVRDPEVAAHLKSSTRVKVTDDNGQQRYTWHHTGPDHLAHAASYDAVARLILPKVQTFTPAVGGTRAMVGDYARVAAHEVGRALDSIR